jgi:hypothetical protein
MWLGFGGWGLAASRSNAKTPQRTRHSKAPPFSILAGQTLNPPPGVVSTPPLISHPQPTPPQTLNQVSRAMTSRYFKDLDTYAEADVSVMFGDDWFDD